MAGISQLSDAIKVSIVKALASKSYSEVGREFGLDKYWPNKNTMRTNINHIWNQVKISSDKFGVSLEIIQMVENALTDRKLNTRVDKTAIYRADQEVIEEKDIKSLAITGRDKSAQLLHRKMDMLSRSRKLLERESIVNLAKVFATFFDKAQIVQGQATEHIAIHAKVSDNLSPEEAMELLLKMREVNMAEKEKVKQGI